MNRPLSYLIFGSLFAVAMTSKAKPVSAKPKMEYHLNWDGTSTKVKINLDYTPAQTDSTVFHFGTPQFGGQQDIFNVLENITAGPGDVLKVKAAERTITVYHHDGGLHQLHYEINGQTDAIGNPGMRQLFRPVISTTRLYLISAFTFLDVDNHKAKSISVQFDQLPAHVATFLSWAPEANPRAKKVISMAESKSSTIVIGTDLSVKKYMVKNIPYYSITSTVDTINHIDQVLQPYFTDYFPAIRNFWNDYDAKHYYLCILPLQGPNQPKKGFGGGFAWGAGFIMKYNRPFDDINKETIAHETSHNWVGGKIRIGSDGFSHQWFGEGFNDFICLINLYKSGVFGKESFLSYLNENNFKAHYTSKVKAAPNDSIASKYWGDHDYQRLPYRRGLIYALYLDNQIRLATGSKHSLRDVMLILNEKTDKKRKSTPDANLSMDDFTEAVSKYLPKEQVVKELQAYMINGTPIDFSTVTLVPEYSMEFKDGIPELTIPDGKDPRTLYAW